MLAEEIPKMLPENSGAACGCYKSHGPMSFGKQILWTLLGVLVVYLIFYVGVLTHNNIKKYDFIGMADQMERTITVAGYGKVTGTNDVAVTSLGFSNTNLDVAKAQSENKKVMDPIASELKKLGLADKDLQTNYTIYPQYNYTQDKGQQLTGYSVTNNITVKIHDLSKIPAVLALAGKFGATQVGGLSFTIDDPENLKDQARQKALRDAELKAVALARSLGVRLVAVVSYYESDASGAAGPYPMMRAEGMGGGSEALTVAPETVSAGSQDVAMNASITYKILP